MKVAWEILKALQLRERGPVLIACPTCGRLQFDMDTVVAEIERRLERYEQPIEVAVLGCAVNGIGEASHADFGITGAKNEGMIFAHGKPLRKVPQDRLVDELFAEIDQSLAVGGVEADERKAAEAAAWLEKIEQENAGELTPERIAQMEQAAAAAEPNGDAPEPAPKPSRAAASTARRPDSTAGPEGFRDRRGRSGSLTHPPLPLRVARHGTSSGPGRGHGAEGNRAHCCRHMPDACSQRRKTCSHDVAGKSQVARSSHELDGRTAPA